MERATPVGIIAPSLPDAFSLYSLLFEPNVCTHVCIRCFITRSKVTVGNSKLISQLFIAEYGYCSFN